MKKNIVTAVIGLVLSFPIGGFAQSYNPETIRSQINEAVIAEQQAFKAGDCVTVLAAMTEDITFLANGRRVPSKKVVEKFCNNIPRPFQEAKTDTMEIFPVSDTVGYTVRTLEYEKDETTLIHELVTKIWHKREGEWKIVHLHSTVKEVPLPD